MNTAQGTYTWQLAKVFASKYAELDIIIAETAYMISISTATGFALDFHGVEAGLYRKGKTRATCTVKCTGLANDFSIPMGSRFATQKGIIYETTEAARLPNIIVVRRGSGNTDDISTLTDYSDVTSISWVNETSSQSGTAYTEGVDFSFSSDEIDWSFGGSAPAEGTYYFVGLDATENISVTIPVISQSYGTDYRVTTGMINVNTDGLSGVSSVTNESDSVGGYDQESNSDYRNRLKRSSRVQFGYDRIATIVAEKDEVRAVNVYQNTGVDVVFPTDDWSEAATWATFETAEIYGGDDVAYAQTWKPSGDRITVAYVGLYAKKTGDPPALKLSLYLWNTDYATTIAGGVLDERTFNKEDVDPDDPTGWQEIQIKCRFGGLDYTRTYMFVVETAATGSDVSNYWSIKYQNEGDEYSDGAMYKDGSIVNSGNADIAFKHRWGGASFNVIVSMETGEDFSTHKDDIEDEYLDFENKSYIPICVQANLSEATTASINVTCTIFIKDDDDWDIIDSLAAVNVYEYINTLLPGDNVVFSRIEKAILNVPGVEKILDCTIQKNAEAVITKATENDILISKDEIAVLGTPGTTFTQGTW